MEKHLRALVVEDDPIDEALLVRELKRGGYDLFHERVDTADAMRRALSEKAWDIIISDYMMPGFGGPAALKLLNETGLDLPFIIISGTVTEENAVDAMRAGARDFMPKGAFHRLLPAIERELQEAKGRAERRRLEDHLRQAQKIETIGQLTGGVAHDFNNVLGVIIGHLDVLVEDLAGEPARAELAREALSAALLGNELTKRLLAVARRQPLTVQVFDLNQRLRGMADMLRRTLSEAVHIDVRTATDLWPVLADPSQVENALLNLAVNARDAMPAGGGITIETSNVEVGDDAGASDIDLKPGEYVVLSVTDTGEGMSEEVIARSIEPFFTTKADGKGTGLGLSTIYGFAKQSNGHLSIRSELGVGTTVSLYLPRSPADASPDRTASSGVSETPRTRVAAG